MAGVWGLIGLEGHEQTALVGAALALQIVVGAALACSARWDRRRWAGSVAILAFLGSVALLREGVGSTAAYGSLILLPVVWSAFRRRRAELVAAIAGGAALLFVPIVAIGGARYPGSGWATGGLFVVIMTVIGCTVLALVERHRRDLHQLRALAASLPRGSFVLFDTDLRYLMAAGPGLSQFGRRSEELEGRTVGELYPPEVAAHLERRFRAALAGEEQRWEVSNRGREYDVRAVPVRDADGRVFGGAVATIDVTERVQHDAEQQALSRVATAVATGAEPQAVFRAVAEEVTHLFAAQCGAIVRFDDSLGIGRIVGACSATGDDITGEEIDLDGTGAAAVVYRTGAPVRMGAYPRGYPDPRLERFAITCSVAAPISTGGVPWGSVGVSFASGPVPAGAEHRLARFAELVAVAVANAEAWEALSRQAATDPVTGLANHRAFYEHLRTEVQRARRDDRPLSVALFDLDHFKHINDRFGHPTGDRVLAEVALRLVAHVQGRGMLARIGGEEFAWSMPETSEADALAAAERARRAIATMPFEGVGRLTISAGVSARAPGQTAEDLVRRADQALYWAKDGGRNSTLLHTAENERLFTTRAVERFATMSSVRAIDSEDVSTDSHSERVAALAEHLAV